MTLKERLEELQASIESKIKKGNFKIVDMGYERSHGYLGELTIKVEGILLNFTLSDDETFFAQGFSNEIKIKNHFSKGDYKALWNAYRNHPDNEQRKELNRIEARRLKLMGDLDMLPKPESDE